MPENPYNSPTSEPTVPPIGNAAKYATYKDVPFFRRQWFFWLCWLVFAPVALAILLSGNVYYMKKGVVVPFGIANKVIGVLFSLIWIYRVYVTIVGNS